MLGTLIRQAAGVKGRGAFVSPPDPRDFDGLVGASKVAALPTKAMFADMRILPRDQGGTNSCVLHAIDHGSQALVDEYTTRSVSAPYWWARALSGLEQRDAGCYVRDGLKAWSNFGAPPDAVWPLRAVSINKQPTADCLRQARGWKGLRYSRIRGTEEARLAGVRAALASRKPVVGGWLVSSAFGNTDTALVSRIKGDAGHAMLLSGYDGNRFRLVNSWGSSWCDGGRVWIAEAAVLDAFELWIMEGLK